VLFRFLAVLTVGCLGKLRFLQVAAAELHRCRNQPRLAVAFKFE
jgi:hypothetical protein